MAFGHINKNTPKMGFGAFRSQNGFGTMLNKTNPQIDESYQIIEAASNFKVGDTFNHKDFKNNLVVTKVRPESKVRKGYRGASSITLKELNTSNIFTLEFKDGEIKQSNTNTGSTISLDSIISNWESKTKLV